MRVGSGLFYIVSQTVYCHWFDGFAHAWGSYGSSTIRIQLPKFQSPVCPCPVPYCAPCSTAATSALSPALAPAPPTLRPRLSAYARRSVDGSPTPIVLYARWTLLGARPALVSSTTRRRLLMLASMTTQRDDAPSQVSVP